MPIPLAKQVCVRLAVLAVFVLAVLALSGAAARAAGADAAKPPDPLIGLQAGASRTAFDPALSWNTFLGGSGFDDGRGVAIDRNGNILVAGASDGGWGTPIRPYTVGKWDLGDVFVAKLSPGGALLWNTFLGGDGMDYGGSIALDADGNIYVGGQSTDTWGLPVQPFNIPVSPFVAKLSTDGALLWNTFIGGGDGANSVAVDKSGNVYVTGVSQETWGEPLRSYTYGQDVFVAKLSSSGTEKWNTFLGGNGTDQGARLAIDSDGSVCAVGLSSESWGSPRRDYVSGGDAFAAKLDTDGGLIWNTFLGGAGNDQGADIAIDAVGNAYVSGLSNAAWGEPLRDHTNANDGFVAKLNSDGGLIWNTFLGGSGGDGAIAIAAGISGDIYVHGYSNATWGSPTRSYTAGFDTFGAGLNSSGTLVWQTFLGGSGFDVPLGIALDGNGYLYLVGYSDTTWGAPISPYTGSDDAFVAKIEGIALDRSLYLPLVAR